MADYTRNTAGRAAAILTNAEVAGNTLSLNVAHEGTVSVDFSLTIASLTNAILRLYGSGDNGTTWKLIHDGSGQECEYTYTVDTTAHISVPAIPGCQKFRATLEGTGTLTLCTANYSYRYLRRGSQS